tara:strand:- start:548 stop:1072 length:525 start_codon:yes stop_codon:yes gene_type:complete
MAILTTLSNFDISNNIVDSNENIIVWYNGTKIKYYHRYEQITTEVETISGIISIKLLSDTNVKITTSSKVRELILTRAGTTNTHTITLDSNYDNTSVGRYWTLSLTNYGNLTATMSSTVAGTATAVALAINNLTNFSASANSNIITYTDSTSTIVQESSINYNDLVATGGGQFN